MGCNHKITSWNLIPETRSHVPDGKLFMHDIHITAYQSCEECSDTLDTMTGEEFLAHFINF